jgi:Ca2+ transporting ATPase
MQKDMCLVRVLASCETMGNAQCICSDKTGTLTQNKMSVRAIFIDNKVFAMDAQTTCDGTMEDSKKLPADLLLSIVENGALNSSWKSVYVPKLEASTGSDEDPKKMKMEDRIAKSRDFIATDVNEVDQVGSKTDCAILLLSDYYNEQAGMGYVKARGTYGVAPMQFDFDHKKKRMTTIVKRPENSTVFKAGSHRCYVKGAPQYLLPLCTTIATSDGPKPLTAEMKEMIEGTVINSFAEQAFRVLLLAYKDIPESDFKDEDDLVSDLTLHCITGIMDPPRDEVIQAIKDCKSAGVTVRMVTGDAKETATAIAVQIGLCTKEEAAEEGTVWIGKDFSALVYDEATDTLDFPAISKIWPKLRVMGRCEPRDKYNLVSGLIYDGEVVAVTGDGTNDAPALAKADVGFAMGLSGTDVAKSASDIVLLDDNFASIVKAISWGRNVYDSISKFLVFQLTVNVVAVLIAFIGSMAIGTTPLRATQLLWVNLIMDTFASLALATEVPVPELLTRKPYKRDDPLLTKHMAKKVLGHAFFQLVVLFIILFSANDWFDIEDGTKADYDGRPTEHLTLVFNTFVWMTLFNQLNARRIDGSLNVFRGLDTNPMYLMIMVSTL